MTVIYYVKNTSLIRIGNFDELSFRFHFSVVIIDLVAIFLIAFTLPFVGFILVCFLLLFFFYSVFFLYLFASLPSFMHTESKWSLERFKCVNYPLPLR